MSHMYYVEVAYPIYPETVAEIVIKHTEYRNGFKLYTTADELDILIKALSEIKQTLLSKKETL